MKDYKITLTINGEERTANWYGYSEQQAIAQAFLSYAYDGARELKVLDIQLK